MHHFQLYSTIPANRHEQALGVLAGVCASQPTEYAEEQSIFAPKRTVASDSIFVQKKKSQAIDYQRYYHSISRNISPIDFKPLSEWSLSIRQEPEAGSPNLISQPYFTPNLTLATYEDKGKFTYVGTTISIGQFFVHGNVVIKVLRIMAPKSRSEAFSTITRDDTTLLDTSGTYLIEASIRLEDRSNSKLADSARSELLDLKRILQGSIQLYAPDRLALDTRLKDG